MLFGSHYPSTIYFRDLIPDISLAYDVPELASRARTRLSALAGSDGKPVIIFDCSDFQNDEKDYIPWFLMRCAEIAEENGIETILVLCTEACAAYVKPLWPIIRSKAVKSSFVIL